MEKKNMTQMRLNGYMTCDCLVEFLKNLLPKAQKFDNGLYSHNELERGLAQTCKELKENECELIKAQ